jgi:hypothetical protein
MQTTSIKPRPLARNRCAGAQEPKGELRLSQNRAARIADLREEVALQVEEISERELTRLLEVMVLLLRKEGVEMGKDEELLAMLQATDTERLARRLEREV